MNGPNVIRTEAPEPSKAELRAERKRAKALRDVTGIRRDNTGGWSAIRRGKLVAAYNGAGAKAKAIQTVGTNRVVNV